jgi:hypothetical protein
MDKGVIMKRTIKISAGVSGVIATGSYENLKPSFLWEEVIEDCKLNDNQIEDRIRELYQKGYDELKKAEQKATIERIERERKDFRFRKNPETGKMVPSVTSIINYDADFFVSQEDLVQYASQGNITHMQVNKYIETKEWIPAEKIKEIWTDIVILKKGKLNLSVENGNFLAFVEKYPIENLKNGYAIFNNEENYSGEHDFTGIPKFKGAEEILTVFDVKRSVDKIKHGMQVAAYSKIVGAKQAILVPINGKTAQGFSKPVIFTQQQLEGYYQMFLEKRKQFKKRYGV